MPPTLPNELISHILTLATPPPDNLSGCLESRGLLRQCCLASKQLCAIAQPLLWEVFPIEQGDTRVLSAFPSLAQHVRVLEVRNLGPGDYRDPGSSRDRLFEMVAKMSGLSELRLKIRNSDSWDQRPALTETNMGQLNGLKHLTRNRVGLAAKFNPTTAKFNLTTVFNNLVTLTLAEVKCTWVDSSFPSLRAICAIGIYGARYLPADFPSGQLDMVQIDHFQDDHFCRRNFKQRYAGVPVLVRLMADFPRRPLGRVAKPEEYEHLGFSDDLEGVRSVQALAELLHLVQSHTLLKSLCLPISLSLSQPLPSNLSSTRDALLKECSTKGIDVIWRLNSMKPEDDACLSRDFWDYAKGLKKKKQLESAAEGSSGGSK